jgi:hypothetical protein
MRTETLTVVAPCDWINANDRTHWTRRKFLTGNWRQASGYAARAARIRPFAGQVDITIRIHKARAGGRWDPHNLMPTGKAAIDGLVDAGVMPDDSRKFLRVTSIEAGETKSRNAITLVITEVAADEVAS